jgi:hypothetical protein
MTGPPTRLLTLLGLLLLALVVGCPPAGSGDDDDSGAQDDDAGDDDDDASYSDIYAAFAGSWEGWSTQPDGIQYQVWLQLETGAAVGEQAAVANYEYAMNGGFECPSTWLRLSEELPIFRFDEVPGDDSPCYGGSPVELEHDATTDTLVFRWFQTQYQEPATGTLERVR